MTAGSDGPTSPVIIAAGRQEENEAGAQTGEVSMADETPGSEDVTKNVPPATARAEAPPVGIQIRPHYWLVWGEVAIDHELEAIAERAAWVAAYQATGEAILNPEWSASMIAIAASVFVIDAGTARSCR